MVGLPFLTYKKAFTGFKFDKSAEAERFPDVGNPSPVPENRFPMREGVSPNLFAIPISIVIQNGSLSLLSFRRPKGGRISEASTEYTQLCVTEILRRYAPLNDK